MVSSVFILRMILQEIFVLWDTIKYDNGTSASHDDSIWTVVNTSLNRQSDYTILTETDTSSNLNTYVNIPNECTIEFEVLQADGGTTSFYCQFYNSNKTSRGGSSINHIGGSLNNWLKVKIELTSTQAVFTNLDTMATATRTISNTDVGIFGFITSSTISTLYFRNFKVYPV